MDVAATATPVFFDFDFRSFDIVSYFDIRISDLTSSKQIAYSQHSRTLVAL
jgi:hypothetical protein